MRVSRKLIIIVSLAACVTIASAAATKTPEQPHYTNLQVLPKNISSKELQSIMADDFEDALGVSCGFCHASNKDGHGLDFASDAKPEKQMTRTMMRMTLGINKTYLKIKHPQLGNAALVVSCNTCHKGQAFPDGDTAK